MERDRKTKTKNVKDSDYSDNNIHVNINVGKSDNHKEDNSVINDVKEVKEKKIDDKKEIDNTGSLLSNLKKLIKEFNLKKENLINKNIDIPNNIFDLPAIEINSKEDIIRFSDILRDKINQLNKILINVKPNQPQRQQQQQQQPLPINPYANNFQTNMRNPMDHMYQGFQNPYVPFPTNTRTPETPVTPQIPETQIPETPIPVNPSVPVPEPDPDSESESEPAPTGGEQTPRRPELQPGTGDSESEEPFFTWEAFLYMYGIDVKGVLSDKKIKAFNSEVSREKIIMLKNLDMVAMDSIERGKWTADEIRLYTSKITPSAPVSAGNGGFREEILKKIELLKKNIEAAPGETDDAGGDEEDTPTPSPPTSDPPTSTPTPTQDPKLVNRRNVLLAYKSRFNNTNKSPNAANIVIRDINQNLGFINDALGLGANLSQEEKDYVTGLYNIMDNSQGVYETAKAYRNIRQGTKLRKTDRLTLKALVSKPDVYILVLNDEVEVTTPDGGPARYDINGDIYTQPSGDDWREPDMSIGETAYCNNMKDLGNQMPNRPGTDIYTMNTIRCYVHQLEIYRAYTGDAEEKEIINGLIGDAENDYQKLKDDL